MRRIVQIALIFLAPIAVFAALVGLDRALGGQGRGRDYVIRLTLPPPAGEVGLPRVEGPLDPSRPLVVIDAGHGGFAPGAGTGSLKEKALTLALAQSLRDALLAHGGIRVALTRDDDRYLLLPERAGIARRLKADLFISIHADSAPGTDASGGTVFTLSERGSSQPAARLAETENRADTLNGVKLSGLPNPGNAILLPPSPPQTTAACEDFAQCTLPAC